MKRFNYLQYFLFVNFLVIFWVLLGLSGCSFKREEGIDVSRFEFFTQAEDVSTELVQLEATTVMEGLHHPWSLALLPSGDLLITERQGYLLRVDLSAKKVVSVKGLPEIHASGQGGLLDVVLSPNFASDQMVYFSFSGKGLRYVGTEVARAKLVKDRLEKVEVIFRLDPKTNAVHHFGSRLVFDKNGHLFITLGDRGERDRAQDLSDHAGSVIRISVDGSPPEDNPFINSLFARDDQVIKAEIFSYGHRNIQGAALNPVTDQLWSHEHGPQGGDELNLIRAGANYGWPIITYGSEYGTGFSIGDFSQEGMEQPLHYWVPSIAPSGMIFYQAHVSAAQAIPEWDHNILVGSLKFKQVVRLKLNDIASVSPEILSEEVMFKGIWGRIRDIKQDPDGAIYIITDEKKGKLIRLSSQK